MLAMTASLSMLTLFESKIVSILIEAVIANITNACTLYVYLDSKRVSILIEAVIANITNVVPCMYSL